MSVCWKAQRLYRRGKFLLFWGYHRYGFWLFCLPKGRYSCHRSRLGRPIGLNQYHQPCCFAHYQYRQRSHWDSGKYLRRNRPWESRHYQASYPCGNQRVSPSDSSCVQASSRRSGSPYLLCRQPWGALYYGSQRGLSGQEYQGNSANFMHFTRKRLGYLWRKYTARPLSYCC